MLSVFFRIGGLILFIGNFINLRNYYVINDIEWLDMFVIVLITSIICIVSSFTFLKEMDKQHNSL